MQKGNYLATLLRSDKTIFTFKDIAMLWHDPGTAATRVRINYYVRKGELIKIRRGIYAKSQDYNRLELATRIFTPAYVSYETILAKEGMIFQIYEPIFVASYVSRQLRIDNQSFVYRKIKDEVLTNPAGVRHVDETSLATPERAFLDILYVQKDFHFDNLRSLDWEKVFEMVPIYDNLRLAGRVNRLFAQSQTDKSP